MSNIKTSKSRKVNIRIPKNIYELLKKIGNENNQTLTSNILYFLENGITRNNVLNNIQTFLDEQNSLMLEAMMDERLSNLGTESKTLERDQYRCRKCKSSTDIMEITLPPEFIGKTFAGDNIENKITLCKNCYMKLIKYIPKKYELERFIEWYYK